MTPDVAHQLWSEFHTWPREHLAAAAEMLTEEEIVSFTRWLLSFDLRVYEQTECACRNHWHHLRVSYPPPTQQGVASVAAITRWTQQMHDRVNEHLGKPLWLPTHGRRAADSDLADAIWAVVNGLLPH